VPTLGKVKTWSAAGAGLAFGAGALLELPPQAARMSTSALKKSRDVEHRERLLRAERAYEEYVLTNCLTFSMKLT